MRRSGWFSARVIGIDHLPEDVAWRLVETLFQQRAALVVGALSCGALGVAGYLGTGSNWYLAGVGYTLIVAAWRLSQVNAFQRARGTATPSAWAIRSLLSGCATALGWGAWTIIVPCESEKALVAMILGIHAGLITGGAVRNNAIKAIATGQIVLASPPLLVGCLLSDSAYLHLYAFVVATHFAAALALVKFLHEQTMRILLSERGARELAAELARANEDLALVNEHLEEQVGLDPLTGLLNRRALDLSAVREWRNAARQATPLAVMMMDIDHFKLFNDHYGHQAGDDCLCIVASAMTGVLRRPGDLLARYGGEEFIAILSATDAIGALDTAERILSSLASSAVEHAAAPLGRVSVSIGVAYAPSTDGRSLKEIIAHADQALYVAKRSGRNCARMHDKQLADVSG